jgi:hypothetical protein
VQCDLAVRVIQGERRVPDLDARLETSAADPVSPATGEPIPRWLMVSGERETTVSAEQLLAIIKVSPDFLRQAATVVGPGTTMVITQPASTASTTTAAPTDFTVLTGEKQTKKKSPATLPAPPGQKQ